MTNDMPKDMNIEIYTLDYCPFCRRALSFLNDHNVNFTQIKIDGNEDEMRKQRGEKYCIEGDVTVPQIIINGERIGGYTDLIAAYDNGELPF